MPSVVLPETRLHAPVHASPGVVPVVPPMREPDELPWRKTPVSFPRAADPVAFVPIKLPCTVLVLAFTCTPKVLLTVCPEMTFPAPAAVPPTVLADEVITTPLPELPSAAVPAELRPM